MDEIDIEPTRARNRAGGRGDARFVAQYDGFPLPTFTWERRGEDFVLIDCNEAARIATDDLALRFLGARATEVYADRPDIVRDITTCAATRSSFRREMDYDHPAIGSPRRLNVTYVFVPPDNVTVHLEDITDRVTTARELTRSQREQEALIAELEGLLDQLPVGILFRDADGRYTRVNNTALEIFGLDRDCVIGATGPELLERTHARRPDGELYRASDQPSEIAYVSGTPVDPVEFIIETGAGIDKHIAVSAAPVTFDAKTLAGSVVVLVDISRQRQAERELRHAQKLELLGQIAGGIAHDFNNLLMMIRNYAEFVMQQLDEGSEMQQDVKEIMNAATRARDLTRGLLDFSRKEAGRATPIDVGDFVKSTKNLIQKSIHESISLVVQADPDPLMIVFDPGQLTQIVLNLVVNARDAMPDGGHLLIQARRSALTRPAPNATGEEQDYVCVSVSDTGLGMEPELLEQIFDPFFTTKPSSRGTGLGLSTVKGIVESAGGFIYATSVPGAGSRFEVFLPCNGS